MKDHEKPPLSEKDLRCFWSKVEKSDGCWLWQGEQTTGRRGAYGQFPYVVDGKRYRRYAFEVAALRHEVGEGGGTHRSPGERNEQADREVPSLQQEDDLQRRVKS